jgi:hypothetical protein
MRSETRRQVSFYSALGVAASAAVFGIVDNRTGGAELERRAAGIVGSAPVAQGELQEAQDVVLADAGYERKLVESPKSVGQPPYPRENVDRAKKSLVKDARYQQALQGARDATGATIRTRIDTSLIVGGGLFSLSLFLGGYVHSSHPSGNGNRRAKI